MKSLAFYFWCWLCFWVWVRIPVRYDDTRINFWLLQYAGFYAHSDPMPKWQRIRAAFAGEQS